MQKEAIMKNVYRIIIFVACAGLFTMCEPDGKYYNPISQDNIADVPIMFTGATTYGANPYYSVGWQGGNAPIKITIDVAAESPLKIKEVAKMIAGATGINAGSFATTANYLPGPVAASNGVVVINTTLAEFNGKFAATNAARVTQANVTTAATSTPATPYAERAFMFLVTLEDNSQIITQQLRLRVTKDF
ncbi:MAG TPA: hypothetical protein VFE50_17225 [Cyclobacteriaceae bacterium]|nr:hypothetical protein [Cyclobacteriaceae bacterium]